MKTVIATDPRLVKQLSKDLIDGLRKRKINEDIIFDVYISFEEALRNAVAHGNRSDISKKIAVETEISDSFIRISVEDEGQGFSPETIPDPTLDENLLRESGRGVYLIKHLMDEVRYENGGRKVEMKKKIAGAGNGGDMRI